MTKRKRDANAFIADTRQRRPIASYAGKDQSLLPGQDVLVCPERKIGRGAKGEESASVLSLLIGPTKTTVIAALASNCNYQFVISRAFGFHPGTVSGAIANLEKLGLVNGDGYYKAVGKRGAPRHHYVLTEAGKSLAAILEIHDEHYQKCIEILKVKSETDGQPDS